MKKEEFIHLFYCPFTGLGFYNGYRGDTWLKRRIEIFKQFTLPSLLNQNTNNFYLWISWRPEEKNNPIVQDFQRTLENVQGIGIIHTFGGLCFWDDKYKDDIASQRLKEALKKTLPHLRDITSEAKYVLMTIQPSDDMYLFNAAERIQDEFLKIKKDKTAIGWRKGYIMNYGTKEIAEYSTIDWTTDDISTYTTNTSPPFYTIIFPREVFIDWQKHYKHIGPYKSHEYVKDFMPMYYFEDRGFVVGTHGTNISTTFNHRYKGRILTKSEQEEILIKTGTLFSDPVYYTQGIHLLARKILNTLPFEAQLRKWYRTLPIWIQKL